MSVTKRLRSLLVLTVTGSITAVGLLGVGALPAQAAPAPVVPLPTSAVTADRLPTVQVDGVVWSQAVVGNTVYAGGRFSNARPAGAAAGTQQTTRNNLLAYDITTGNLVTTFAPNLNGQVLSVAASPDGTRIYVVGDFTTANGTARRRVAAYSTATGALVTAFNPSGPNSQARAVIATNDTVYVGGGFAGVQNGTLRNNLVAYRASDGALLPWNPSATGSPTDAIGTVWALGVSSNGASVIAGGSFQNVGGKPAYGLAKIAGSGTGELDESWKPSVRNAGKDAGISSLRVQNDMVYGTTWHFGPGGNLEGTFKVPVANSDVEWVTDCHGDAYSSYMTGGVVYVASHAHYCGNMGGGMAQYPAWKFLHAQAWTDTAGGEILNEVHGYPNWHGQEPAPSIVSWNPDMAIGSVTGQYQAGWNVTGNNDYVVFGGEFPRVNGVAQQGLVRFAKRSIAPKAEGPKFNYTPWVPTVQATSPTSARVSWPAAYDRDDYTLRYRAIRNGATGSPRYTVEANSNWWSTPSLGFTDTGLTPGQTYTYQIIVNDPGGNQVFGSSASITMPASVPAANAYTESVRSNGARIYWPLNETSGTVAFDRAAGSATGPGVGVTDGRTDTGVTWGQPGAIAGDTAASLGDNDWSRIFAGNCPTTDNCNTASEVAPDTFTSQVWIKTDTNRGGRILGFGDLQNGGSGHRDRHVYMDNSGKVFFGVRAQDGSNRTVSSARSYNDNQWHQVSATLSAGGMALYVDGVRVGKRTDTTQGEAYNGFWRVGGDNLDGWSNTPNTRNFIGAVDEVAIYPTALTQDQIIGQYTASGRTSVVPPAPADTYGAAVYADDPDLFWRLGESSGTKAADSGKSLNDGTYRNGATLGQPGAIAGNTAAGFNGNNQFVSSDGAFSNPTVYTEEAWFKTATNDGGKIIGFGNTQDGNSGGYDRHVYMQNDGKLVFGVWTGQTNVITTAGKYNDNTWHHVVATQSGNGMKLYVDGVLTGTNPQTAAQDYTGYWKVGGDVTWGSNSNYLNGTIDEAAIYSYELTPQRVLAHFQAGGGVLNQAPTAAFESSSTDRKASFDATGSNDQDGTIASYAWEFGDNTTGTGATPSHVYGAAGTYNVKLTVTDNKGEAASVTHPVTITAPPAPADNYGAAVVADGPDLFWRFNETSGDVANDAGGARNNGHFFNGYTQGETGALPNNNKAVKFDGNNGFASSDQVYDNPLVYTQEAWFKTSTIRGGKIIGFGRNREGSSSSYDRHIYMQDDGHLVFGTYTGQLNTITSPASYNNGQWHHVVASQSGNGMKLYVDGELVGTNPQTSAENYPGYWKVGGDNTWGSSSAYLDGTIDEVAVYLKELSASRVAAHYAAAAPEPNKKPTADFTVSKTDLKVDVDASTSVDTDGEITAYSWNFGDGWTGTGKVADHTYATAGTKTITLTVTDDDGETDTKAVQVSVQAANQLPTADFDADVTNLKVDFDAGDSDDPDGTIESYAWDFGDGATGTGETPTHTYTEAKAHTVTLTVTDNRNGTATVSKQVTTTEPPNQDPVPAFAFTTDALKVDVDASNSSDPDGSVTGYAWKFGNDGTGTGKITSHTFTAAGTYDVELTVTDNKGATKTLTQQVTVSPANQSPVADFDATVTNLKVDLDAGDSDDPDGTITGYAWNYGDNTTGTGETASHTYAAAGTYTVTLTVTDNKGATGVATRQVEVTEPPNQDPTARYTYTTANLVGTFNGTTSSDPDGSIASYSWNFGDNTTGTGATPPAHTFPSAGTYTVVLTVTDNKGAVDTESKQVVVTAPTSLAADNFNRTATNAWGAAQTGGTWTISSGTTNFAVGNGVGTIRMAASSGPSAYLNGVSATNVDVTGKYSYDKPGSGGGVYTSLVARRIGTSDYRIKVQVTATGTTAYLVRTVNGTETTLGSQAISGGALAAGDVVNARLQLQGTGTTTLRAKVWIKNATEPTAWTLNATDTTAALQNPGAVGIYTYLSGSATNAPITVRVDDFRVEPL